MEITLGKQKKEGDSQQQNQSTSAQQQSQHQGLFSSKKPENTPNLMMQVTSQINNVATRLKIMEDRYNNLRRKIQVLEDNMLRDQKKTDTEVKATNAVVNETNQTIHQLKDNIKLIINELKLCAKNEDVDVLKRYIDLWEPLQYVTHNEFDHRVREIVDEKLREQENSNDEEDAE
jgi:hypothetical protein